MPEQDLDVEQSLRELVDLLDIQRAEIAKMFEVCSNNPLLFDQVPRLKSACTNLDRAATQLQQALDTGLQMGFADEDPRQIRRIQIAQYRLLGVWMKTLSAVIEVLEEEGEVQEELAN